MKRLRGEFEWMRRRLLSWAGAGVWFACAALAVTAILGWIDPFGIRQRIDWAVSDQFLTVRPAPPIHHDILLVAIDDGTFEQFGFPLPRATLAGAVRQIHKLGARATLIDILLTEPQRKPVLEDAERWLLPAGAVISGAELGDRLLELKQRFTEDQVLARALEPAESVVIPFSFLSRETIGRGGGAPGANDPLTRRIADLLIAAPQLSPDAIATRLGVSDRQVRPLFGPALDIAMTDLARRHIERHELESPDVAASQILAPELIESYVGIALRRAFDRAGAQLLLMQNSSVPAEHAAAVHPRATSEEIKPPRMEFAEAAAASGFADIPLDSDGTLRRIALCLEWNRRLVFHQSVVAAAVLRGLPLDGIEFRGGLMRDSRSGLDVAVDSACRLTINWPMNRTNRWNEVIPMISIKDISELDRYESELNLLSHRRREYYKEMARLADGNPKWDEGFAAILAAQRVGKLDDVAARERAFDAELLPAIQQIPAVVAAIERARTTARPEVGAEPDSGLVQYARAIHDIDSQITETEPEYGAAFRDLQGYVRDKLCLIGDTTTGSTDLKQTPPDAAMPGVAVNAAAINTMLTGSYLSIRGYLSSVVALLLVAGGLIRPFLRLSAGWAGSCVVAAIAAAFFGSYALLVSFAVFISPVTPVIGLVAVYVTTSTYRWFKEYRERQLVRTIFEAQTNPTIVERLIAAGHAGVEEVLVPKTRQVTVFFAEIAGYDELTATLAPERLPELLSHTFGTMAKIILAHEGTLDRYQGHAMVAFFGAPVYQPDHAARACRAALECCDTLRVMEPAWCDRGLPAPRVQVGIHTGELLVGNITLTSRVDYTVAGENLNVAYRIGELNEVYGTQVMMSEATLAHCDNVAEARELDLVRIKGRREPVRAFELMSAKGRLTNEQLHLRGTFNTGLIAFRNRDYAGALAMFRSCRATSPGDRPATVYIERCERELAVPAAGETARS